jgi:NADH dehydrogenase FAD-containing subunit
MSTPVLIVGAGPVGLTLACELTAIAFRFTSSTRPLNARTNRKP